MRRKISRIKHTITNSSGKPIGEIEFRPMNPNKNWNCFDSTSTIFQEDGKKLRCVGSSEIHNDIDPFYLCEDEIIGVFRRQTEKR